MDRCCCGNKSGIYFDRISTTEGEWQRVVVLSCPVLSCPISTGAGVGVTNCRLQTDLLVCAVIAMLLSMNGKDGK